MEKIENIVIIGMGALGVLYGDYFVQKLGSDKVTFVADEGRIGRYRREGVFCNGRKCGFQFATGDTYGKKADLLIFAVKATALDEAVREAGPLVGPGTILLSLLNGIVSEERIGEAFDMRQVLYCVAQGMDAVKLANRLTYTNMGELRIGVLPGETEKQPMLLALSGLFDEIGLPYVVEEDMRRRLWSKWMLNVGVNQVVMVERGTYGTVQQPRKARELMKSAMREVIELAALEGVQLIRQDMDGYIALVDTLDPEGMPSMRQDGIELRPSEVELFAGTVIRKAKQHGIAVPVNEMLYRAVCEMEARYPKTENG